MASVFTGVDLGSHTVRVLQGRMKGTAFVPTRFLARERAEGESAEQALADLLSSAKVKAPAARIGLTGSSVILRYSQVPKLTDVQLKNLMRFEIDELSQQYGGSFASDFNLLPIPPGVTGDDTVLIALARNESLDAVTSAVARASSSIGAFTPNGVALYDAFLKLGSVGEDGVLLANIGEENTDVAIVVGPDLAFARSVSQGGRKLTAAIQERLGFDAERAEEAKRALVNLAPAAKGRYKTPQEEKVTNALLGAAGEFASLLRSTALLAKEQLKLPELRITRAFLCGGGSRLLGLPEYLSAATGWNVALLDPLETLDLGSLPAEERAALEEQRHEAVVSLGLALATADRGLYRIDILPEALVKKRRFLERTSWLIAAGALAGVSLGAEAVVRKGLGDDAARVAADSMREAKQIRDIHDKTLKLVGGAEVAGANPALAETATDLELRASIGQSLLLLDRGLRHGLHPDLWVVKTALKIDKSPLPDLKTGDLRRPLIIVSGRGREGAERIDTSFRSSTEKLTEMFPGLGMVQTSKMSQKGFEWEITLNFFPVAPPAKPDVDNAR